MLSLQSWLMMSTIVAFMLVLRDKDSMFWCETFYRLIVQQLIWWTSSWKMKNLISAAKLRHLTPLGAKTSCHTSWSSTFEMLQRFKMLEPFIRQMDDDDIIELIPSVRHCKQVDELLLLLAEPDSVTRRFQNDTNTVAYVRAIVEELATKCREVELSLWSSSDIIVHPLFEQAVANFQDGNQSTLTDSKRKCVSLLRKTKSSNISDRFAALPFAERMVKRWRVSSTATSEYLDFCFIQPMSNVCERFFDGGICTISWTSWNFTL